MCQGSNCRIKVSLLFSLIPGFSPNLSPPCPVAPSLLTFLTAFPYLPKGKLTLGEISENIYLKSPSVLRSVPGSLNPDKEELVAVADEDSGSCWSLLEHFPVLCYFTGLYSSERWVAFGHPAHLPRAGHAEQPQFQICFKRHGMDKDLYTYFLFYILGMKWLIFKSWIFSLYKSDNQMPNISSRWWVCQETINWKEQISPEKEERTARHQKMLPMDV